jgi:hypothetical protein
VIDQECEYKFDVFKLNLSGSPNNVSLEIMNVISWDSITLQMTREELVGLADFVNNYLGEK